MSSMLYTMGMALDRAAENGFSVRLLVEGCWLDGHVAGNDGVGVDVVGWSPAPADARESGSHRG